jgi:alkylation response protein AidB-like acyl-CoA dehydrogenase
VNDIASRQDLARDNELLRSELLAKAQEVLPVLRANAAEADAARRLPDATVAALDEAGFLRLRSPRRFGGLEADLRTYHDAVAELAKGCSSASWIGFISNASAWVTSAVFPERVLEDIFGENPSARFIGLLAPTAKARAVDGGFVVDGRWGFASNCLHAQWAMLTVPLPRGGEQFEPSLFVVPMSELTIEDTWYVTGMCGTGSNHVVATEVFVPAYRTVGLGAVLSGQAQRESANTSPAYAENFVISAVHMVAAPVLGMAKAALDLTLERLSTGKAVSYTFYEDTRQAPSTQLNLAKAATLIDTASLLLDSWADRTVVASWSRSEFGVLERTRFRAHFGYAIDLCRDAMKLLMNVQGASGFAKANPIERVWRDLETASRHGLLSYEMGQEMFSRALLGIDEQISPII